MLRTILAAVAVLMSPPRRYGPTTDQLEYSVKIVFGSPPEAA
jgi:hypothetical protein